MEKIEEIVKKNEKLLTEMRIIFRKKEMEIDKSQTILKFEGGKAKGKEYQKNSGRIRR